MRYGHAVKNIKQEYIYIYIYIFIYSDYRILTYGVYHDNCFLSSTQDPNFKIPHVELIVTHKN